MQIILLEKVVNLGGLGDVVKVKDGYARNFLIPQGKAKRATPENLAEFETRRAELEKAQADALAEAQEQRREARRPDGPDHAEGRRGRPAVRLGHQRRHRRGAARRRASRSSAPRSACRRGRSRRSAITPSRSRCTPTSWSTITVSVLGESSTAVTGLQAVDAKQRAADHAAFPLRAQVLKRQPGHV